MEGLQLSLLLGRQYVPPPTDGASMGEVFTRRWVVELILDLAGYTPDNDLAAKVAVEPACGTGAFLEPMVERLVESAKIFGRDISEFPSAISAFDLQPEHVEGARKLVSDLLVQGGLPPIQADQMARTWVQLSDFLLEAPADLVGDFVIGNPPYIRLEDVPAGRTAAYREACPTMKGRSDVYVGFIERGLRLLCDGGTLGFIVADRWMHNQYGAELRRLVSEHFSVEVVIEMHDTDAFEDPVSAYPAITIIRKCQQDQAVLASASKEFGPASSRSFARWATQSAVPKRRSSAFLLGITEFSPDPITEIPHF